MQSFFLQLIKIAKNYFMSDKQKNRQQNDEKKKS